MNENVRLVDPAAALQGYFDSITRERGHQYVVDGRAKLEKAEAGRVVGWVRGSSGTYRVELQKSKEGWAMRCTCPLAYREPRCKHMWALVVRTGLEDWKFEVSDNQQLGRLVRKATWHDRLRRLEWIVKAAAPATREDAREQRIQFVLHLDRWGRADSLTIEARKTYRLKSGKWSAPSALKSRDREDPAFSALERQVLALLHEAGAPSYGMKSAFSVEEPVARVVLSLAQRAGNLAWMDPRTDEPVSLTFEDAPEWKLVRMLAPHEDGSVQLSAFWQRGENKFSIQEVVGPFAGRFVIGGDVIAPVANEADIEWAAELLHDGPVVAPREELAKLANSLRHMRQPFDVDPALELVRRQVVPTGRLVLAAPTPEQLLRGELVGELQFRYETVGIEAGTEELLFDLGDSLCARDRATEARLVARLRELGVTRESEHSPRIQVPLGKLGEITRTLTAEGWSVEGEGARLRTAGSTHFSVRSGVDWFGLEGAVDFDGERAELPALLAALRKRERLVELGDGRLGVLPEDWIAKLEPLVALGETRKGELRFQRNQAWLLDALLAGRGEIEADRTFKKVVAGLDSFRKVEPANEPAGFQGELRPYQREGLGWLEFLERHGLGGCLADDMGLGKTVQVLAWLVAHRAREKPTAPALVVAPKSLVHNWIAEARRFAPGLVALDFTGTARRSRGEELQQADLVVTTYGTLRQDVERFGELEFDCAILDEAQAIKNATSQTAKAARLLRARQRLALSGTPIENHLGELWSLFEFLNPGMLGRSTAFSELVSTPAGSALDPRRRELLARLVRPFVLRRTKEQVLRDLPERLEQTIRCQLDAQQRKDYDALNAHYRKVLLGGPADAELDRFNVLEALLRLRQSACHPGLLDASRATEPSAKLDTLLELVGDALENDHKALIFSQFTSLLAIVRARLDERKIEYAYIDGSVTAKQRAQEVERFQSPGGPRLLLSSLKAGGVGLNLTAADYVFLLDPWWNPAAEAQAIGRAHRIGQERKVLAYRLVAEGTIEERVLELQDRKRALAEALFDGEATTLRSLTREDLAALFA